MVVCSGVDLALTVHYYVYSVVIERFSVERRTLREYSVLEDDVMGLFLNSY